MGCAFSFLFMMGLALAELRVVVFFYENEEDDKSNF